MGMRYVSLLDYADIDNEFPSTVSYGNFGSARREVKEATGAENYNLRICHIEPGRPNTEYQGVVDASGTTITIWGSTNSVEKMVWLSREEVEKLKEARDHIDSPRWVDSTGFSVEQKLCPGCTVQ